MSSRAPRLTNVSNDDGTIQFSTFKHRQSMTNSIVFCVLVQSNGLDLTWI